MKITGKTVICNRNFKNNKSGIFHPTDRQHSPDGTGTGTTENGL
jgi:hypothetical protein